MSNFGGRERESGTVTFHVSLFKCPGWKFVGKVHSSWNFDRVLLCYCWMILWVDECSNEDPGPLPGPRYLISVISPKLKNACTVDGHSITAPFNNSYSVHLKKMSGCSVKLVFVKILKLPRPSIRNLAGLALLVCSKALSKCIPVSHRPLLALWRVAIIPI